MSTGHWSVEVMRAEMRPQSGPPTAAERSAVLYTRKQLEALHRMCTEQVGCPITCTAVSIAKSQHTNTLASPTTLHHSADVPTCTTTRCSFLHLL